MCEHWRLEVTRSVEVVNCDCDVDDVNVNVVDVETLEGGESGR